MELGNNLKRSLIEITFYVMTGLLTIFLSMFAGFVLKGFAEPILTGSFSIQSYLGSYLLYGMLIVLGIFVGILFPINNAVFIKGKEKPWTQDSPSWYRIFTVSWIYNPEQSFIWYLFKKNKGEKEIRWLTNIVRVIFISVILFGLLGLLQLFVPQLATSGVPPSQQFSESADIIFGSVVPAFAENGALLLEMFLLAGVLAFLVSKFIKDKNQREPIFWGLALLILPIILGFSWSSFHSIVYGNDEASQWATFIFGYISSLLTLFTGIFIFFFLGHFFNNFVIKLSEFVTSNETLAIWYGLGMFGIIILYAIFEYNLRKKRKRSKEQMLVQ